MIDQILKRRAQYLETFESEAGRDVLEDLKKFCHYRQPTYVVSDPYQTAYNEGMRRVILRITSIMEMKLDDISNSTLQEHTDE